MATKVKVIVTDGDGTVFGQFDLTPEHVGSSRHLTYECVGEEVFSQLPHGWQFFTLHNAPESSDAA